MSEIHWMGIVDLARAIAGKKISPVEVVRAYLQRIEKLDGRLKSYIAVFGDAALEAARSAEVAVGREKLGPLHGVPVAVKDLYDVNGTPTTGGSSFLKEPAKQDCTVVARLCAAGAIILGKLNLHEFAYGPEGINPHFGTTWNPWDEKTHRMAGGSSSGSGVAVAAGLAPMGMGSDTGGSIRIPAACCGTVGLKPTYGRVSRIGILPLSWSLDHAGPLTCSVGDAAAILSAIAGHDPADPSSSTLPVPDYVAACTAGVKGMRIGLLSQYVGQADLEVQQAIGKAAQVLEKEGCTVQEVALPRAKYAVGAAHAVLASEAFAYHHPLLVRHGKDYGSDVRCRLLAGRFISASDYLKGQRARRLLRDEVSQALQEVDCLLAPTLAVPAPPITAKEVRINDRSESLRPVLPLFTRLFNLTGHPVVVLPCGFSGGGLPLSMQLVGRAFDEATILRVANAYEGATEWHKKRPPGIS